MASQIEIAPGSSNGKDAEFRGYLATPAAGSGPGIVLCQEIFGVNASMREIADAYAEEGYTVLVPDLFWRIRPGIELGYSQGDWKEAFALFKQFDVDKGMRDLGDAVRALKGRSECTGPVAALGFCLGGTLAFLAAARCEVDCAVGYYGVGIQDYLGEVPNIKVPMLLHFAERDSFCPPPARQQIEQALRGRPGVELYTYPDVDHAFARPSGDHFDKVATALAHQRSIAMLKSCIGPDYNLSELWDKHLEHEFATRDVEATMATMVPEPYVNHIPTMTGGVGYRQLHRFYKHHFVDGNPPDTRIVPISRTIGANQIVDEVMFSFTHTTEIEWLAPGVPPTGRPVEFPIVAIVRFRGDKLCHEHLYWDQASVLKQMGVLDSGTLPVAGVEASRKLLDESLPSNELMAGWHRSEAL